ncbi:MAG: prepilin peptidase [Parcubacteria group bacterium]|nr:prepilin peptidase [Parcubacteria group bacterium]
METIQFIVAISYFIFGVIVGSFLNVVALRHNTGQTVLGRSNCFSCGKNLSWFELIPIFSFIFQLGKCRVCKSKISWQYPFIELTTGLIFLGIFLKISDLLFISPIQLILTSIYFIVIFSILIVILVYDLRHKIIPDDLVYTFATLSLASMFFDFSTFELSIPTLLPVFSGPILFAPFFLLWFVSSGRWIGLGDGKLALGIGWFLGLSLGASAIMISFWVGAVVGIFLMLISALYLSKKRLTMKSEIPFGPFLILGLILVFFFEIDILNFIL